MENTKFEQKIVSQMKADLISKIEAIEDFTTISGLHSFIKGFMKQGLDKNYIIIEKKEATSTAK